MSSARILLLLLAGLICSSLPLAAQHGGNSGKNAPDIPIVTNALAITNARLVLKPGSSIERGTVVVRNGLIESVGASVQLPPDARVIDGTGLTVYAGFIDGYSWAGSPAPENRTDSVAKAGDPPDDRAGITPQRDIRDLYEFHAGQVDSLRRAGFAVAHLAPRGGMLPGRGALMFLGGNDTARFVIRGNASLVARFQGANNVYPATPMGIMAKLRNLYRQAEGLKESDAKFRSDPNGFERPIHDPVRASFFGPIDGTTPILFQVEDDLEVRRALLLSRELGFPLVLAGLKEGRDVAELIRAEKTPLFLSLDFPEEILEHDDSDSSAHEESDAAPHDTTFRPQVTTLEEYMRTGGKATDFEDVEGERLRLIAVRDQARAAAVGTPAFYNRSGTTFGFATAGVPGRNLRSNLIEAVHHGLSEDAALAALTTNAAKLLGMERLLGTLDRGKSANLVITTGPYFQDTSSVKMVVVDGVVYDYSSELKEKKEGDSATLNASESMPVLTAENAAEPLAPGRAVDARRDKSGDLLVRNATVLTVTNGTLENTDVLVRKGVISAIGRNLSAPSGVQVVDGTDRFLMPGIIDAHSHIAVSGPVNEWTNPVTAEVRIEDVIDPYDITIYRALAGGVTVSHVMHGSANPIGGQGETIKHRYGEIDPEKLKMEDAPRTIKFALGENPTRVHGRGFGVPPYTRMGVEQSFRQAFTQAQRYMAEWETYRADTKAGKRVAVPTYDLRMETLADILRGKILVHCHSYRADEILMLMRVLKDFGVKNITFQHVNEGFKVAPELAEFGAMASVFSDWWAYKFEVYYSTAYNAAILTRNGVVTSINSDSPELNRHLYHEAAKSLRNGELTEDECLAMITINPAKQLGIGDRVGSIEEGKQADLALFSAHPLSVYARPLLTVVDGVVRFDAENDPDDMRLRIDPEENVSATMLFHEHDDRCMEGVEDAGAHQ